jgi:hypothetical protein
VLERLLASASGSDRSLRSVGPPTGIGTRVCQINGPRPDRTRIKVRSWPPNTQSRILTPRSVGHRVHTERGTGVLLGAVALDLRCRGGRDARGARIGPTSFFADQTVSSRGDQELTGDRFEAGPGGLNAQRLAMRIRFASSFEVELAVEVQIEIGVKPYPTFEYLDRP